MKLTSHLSFLRLYYRSLICYSLFECFYCFFLPKSTLTALYKFSNFQFRQYYSVTRGVLTEMFYKKLYFKVSQCSQQSTHVFESLFNKGACAFRRQPPTQFFPLNVAKFLRGPILQNICKRLVLRNTVTPTQKKLLNMFSLCGRKQNR